MKFCKDCQHGQGARCAMYPNLVTGGENHDDYRANKSLSREDGFIWSLLMGTCGRRARWFVPVVNVEGNGR